MQKTTTTGNRQSWKKKKKSEIDNIAKKGKQTIIQEKANTQ